MSHRLTSWSVLPVTLVLLTGGLGIRGLYGEEKPATQPNVTQEVDKSADENAAKPSVPWIKLTSATNLYLRIVPLEWAMLEKFAEDRDIPWMESVYNQLKKQNNPKLLQWRIDPTLPALLKLQISDPGVIDLPHWLDESPYYYSSKYHYEDNNKFKTSGMVLLLDGDFQLPKESVEALTSRSGTGETSLSPILDSFALDEWDFKKAFVYEFLRVNLDFPGGDFAQWVVALQDSINVAYEQQMPDILKPIMPPKITLSAEADNETLLPRRVAEVKIKNMNLASQRWLNPGSSVRAFAFKINAEDPRRWKLSQTGAGSLHTMLMTDNHIIYRMFGADSPEPVAYFNLSSAYRPNAANQLTAENVAALLDIRWKMNGPFVWGKTFYHPETDMMIVSGTDSEIELAKEVFKALTVKTDSVFPKRANPAQPEAKAGEEAKP